MNKFFTLILILCTKAFSMQTPSLHKVFVYGTLKKGEPNHYWLTDESNGNSTYIASGKTSIKYPLVIASRYNIPFILDQPGLGYNVIGEMYEVDDSMLKNLDILEDHPKYYRRREEEIVCTDGKNTTCWVYFLNGFKPYLLDLQMFENYSSRGDHGLPYRERYLRDPNYNYKSEILVNSDI